MAGVLFLVHLAGFLLNGLVALKLWAWFAVPLGVPAVTYGHALGLTVLAALLTHQWCPATRNELERIELATYSVVAPLTLLLTGWIVHSCG